METYRWSAASATGEEILFEDVAELLGATGLDAQFGLQRRYDPILGPRLFTLFKSNQFINLIIWIILKFNDLWSSLNELFIIPIAAGVRK